MNEVDKKIDRIHGEIQSLNNQVENMYANMNNVLSVLNEIQAKQWKSIEGQRVQSEKYDELVESYKLLHLNSGFSVEGISNKLNNIEDRLIDLS